MTRKQADNVENQVEIDHQSLTLTAEGSERLSRRKLLAGGIAAAIGALASAVLPRKAEADDGDNLVIGQANVGQTPTSLEAQVGPGGALSVTNPSNHNGEGPGDSALRAEGFIGLRAGSSGVKTFQGPGEEPVGVMGHYKASPSDENAFGAGVVGSVISTETVPEGWPADSDKGVGVKGTSGGDWPWEPRDEAAVLRGTGVAGVGSRNGVMAASVSGFALRTEGKVHFSRSGRGTIRRGRYGATVHCPDLAEDSMIHVTLQGYAGPGRCVAYTCRRSSSCFNVVLNHRATRTARFAWFVLD